jgi:hypothetical protein
VASQELSGQESLPNGRGSGLLGVGSDEVCAWKAL